MPTLHFALKITLPPSKNVYLLLLEMGVGGRPLTLFIEALSHHNAVHVLPLPVEMTNAALALMFLECTAARFLGRCFSFSELMQRAIHKRGFPSL